MEPESLLPYSQVPDTLLRDTSSRNTILGDPSVGVVSLWTVWSPDEAFCLVFLNMGLQGGGVVSTSPNPQTGGPPLLAATLHIGGRSSIRNLRNRHTIPRWQRPNYHMENRH